MTTNALQGQLLRRLAERGGRVDPSTLGVSPKILPGTLLRCRQMKQVQRHDDGTYEITDAGRLAMLTPAMRAALLDLRERGEMQIVNVTHTIATGAIAKATARALDKTGLAEVDTPQPKRPAWARLTAAGKVLADRLAAEREANRCTAFARRVLG